MNNKRNIKFLTKEEVEQIINAIPAEGLKNKRDKAILEVLFSTGLRISELLALKRNDLAKDPSQTLELVVRGKGGYQGCVYIPKSVLRVVLRYFAGRKDDKESVFPLGIRQIQRMVHKRAKEAGIDKPLTVHSFRHSFATFILNKTGNIRLCQEMLRHRSISSTEIYTHLTSPQLKLEHEKLFRD